MLPAERHLLSLSLGLSATATSSRHVEECTDNGPACPGAYQHVQRLYAEELTLDAAYGITSWLGVDLLLPIRSVTTRIRYENLAGDPYTPEPPDTHHENETLLGPGDPWLLAHFGGASGDWSAAGKLGVALPLGSTVEDPFALGRQGLPHEHVQFGTGTFDPLVGVAAERRFPGWSIAATALARLVLYENGKGYRSGQRVFGTLLARSALGTGALAFTLGLDAYHESAERWRGVVEEEGNLGRTDVLVDAGVSRRLGAASSMTLGARVPIYVDAVGAQVSYPAIVTLGVSTSFGADRTSARRQ